MTSHRLIRCDLPTLFAAVTASTDGVKFHEHQRGHRAWAQWSSRAAHHDVTWTLHVERGANGVLAHLSALPSHGLLCRFLPETLWTVNRLLSSHALTELARSVETAPSLRGADAGHGRVEGAGRRSDGRPHQVRG